MSQFTEFNEFILAKIGTTKYVLQDNLVWEIGRKGSCWAVCLADNYRTFDITVPWYVRPFQDPHDRAMLPAAALHDYLLEEGFDITFAAGEFRRACIARGVSKSKAWLAFFATLIYPHFPGVLKCKSNSNDGPGKDTMTVD